MERQEPGSSSSSDLESESPNSSQSELESDESGASGSEGDGSLRSSWERTRTKGLEWIDTGYIHKSVRIIRIFGWVLPCRSIFSGYI